MNVRKIQRLGSSSLIITLPKTWVKRTGVRPGDNVYVIERENELILIPFVTEEPLGPPVIVNVKNLDANTSLDIIKCLIKNGFKNIILTNEAGFTDEYINTIEESIKKINGYTLDIKDSTRLQITGKLEIDDAGQLLREIISTVAHTIELLTSIINGEEVKIEETPEKEKLTEDNHIKITHRLLSNLDVIKGELLEERRRALTLYLYETAWYIMASLQEKLLYIMKTPEHLKITEKDTKEKVLFYIKLLESAMWETIGGITNESEKRLITAEKLVQDAEKYYNEKLMLEKIGNPRIAEIIGVFTYLSSLLKKLIKDSRCLTHYSNVKMD